MGVIKNSNKHIYIPLANGISGYGANRPEEFEFMQGGEEKATGVYKDIHEDCERRSQRSRNSKCDGYKTMDGNEAVAYVAYRTNEICIIYPITPASQMGELSDQWASEAKPNVWGTIPHVVEMQSEAGASGTIHGALQTGALTTTFTASQGLLLMIPNMFRIAGDMTPTVFHVACRSVANQGMTIYCEHSDAMATRTTGFAMLCSSSVQEAHDFALIAQAASLQSKVPFLHFFDGFRTSHEITKIELLSEEQMRALINNEDIFTHRKRRLTSDNPVVRGVIQNSDTYFQAREAVNPYYDQLPNIVESVMQKFKATTGREYGLVEYFGSKNAEDIIVIMGSGAETAVETAEYLAQHNEKVGVLKVHLFRPFPKEQFLKALPASCKTIAILDRTKEPGSAGEPLYEEIATTLLQSYCQKQLHTSGMPKVIAGRYGIASKEFTPAMVKAIFDELKKEKSKNNFTIGINDDVTHTSLSYDATFDIEPDSTIRAIFYGLGADGTVGANKNTIKIIGEETPLNVQAYFVYDSKKSGSKTISHLRFGPTQIRSTYLIRSANFIGCHQFNFIKKTNVLEYAKTGATFLLNSIYPKEEVWHHLPLSLQQTIIDKKIKFYIIDAYDVAMKSSMGARINTIMQTCFFALSNVLPKNEAIQKIKEAIQKTYANKGEAVVKKNFAAVDNTLANLCEIKVPSKATGTIEIPAAVPAHAPDFVRQVTAKMIEERGDELAVSEVPFDGTYPLHTTRWEKRNVALETPVWDPNLCIQCGQCSMVCPHSVIRTKNCANDKLTNAPNSFKAAKSRDKNFPDHSFTLQCHMEDCTGCGLCHEACPVNAKDANKKKAINLEPKPAALTKERENMAFFEQLPINDVSKIDTSTVRGAQFLPPMFEFCGACAGCGEAPYIRLLTQLFGDRLILANACGCTSVYGGQLPTSPWTLNEEGRGPAWESSLFEDNAEFGYGFRLSADKHREYACELMDKLQAKIGENLINAITNASQNTDAEIKQQRQRVAELKQKLQPLLPNEDAAQLLSVADQLVKHSTWAIGGDGWAYDIGYAGLDHVLASGRNINLLVLDTEVYSNTGGQASKATPRGAVVKFAAQGKKTSKKDLGLIMTTYGSIYVANIALGANPAQALKAMYEAESYDGPSLIIAYSHCIAHGIDMRKGMQQQKLAVKCGYWPLYRYNPERIQQGLNPFQLDSERPSIPFKDYAENENRYQILARSNPQQAEKLMKLAEQDIKRRWKQYEALTKWEAEAHTR